MRYFHNMPQVQGFVLYRLNQLSWADSSTLCQTIQWMPAQAYQNKTTETALGADVQHTEHR